MALEKNIIKAQAAETSTFDYKPREIDRTISNVAKSFVSADAFQSTDFKISELVAQQVGISRLESDAHTDKINAQVLDKLKEVQEEAYKRGFELGQIEGAEKAFQATKAELIERLQGMLKLLQNMEQQKKNLLIDNEAEMLGLIFLIAKKLVFKELDENREAVLEILRNVIGEMQEDERVTVRLSPDDMYFLETLQEKGGQRIDLLNRVKFEAHDEIKPGGCVVDTAYGSVDATLEERVNRLWQTLAARIPQKPIEKKE